MRKNYARSLTTAGILLLVLSLILPTIPYLWISATAGATSAAESGQSHPGVNFWHSVRRGEAGYSVTSGSETAVFINSNGQSWRQYRTEILVPYASYLMATVLVLIALFFLLRGPIQIKDGASGRLLLRFSINQRVIHWFTAILFWLLALTGLILLYGRLVLIPLLGARGFAITASACKEAHNLFGPLFLAALVMLFIAFVRDNFYAKGDLMWLLKGGGMFTKHASAGRFNFGEKTWFWLACLLGLAVSISGLVLDFPSLGQNRSTIELAHVLHTAGAIIFIAISFGHIYLGTIGTQGTLRGMATGYVDANWAEHHHDRWSPDSGNPVVSENQQTDAERL